jgi:hypothetical protein
MKIGWMIMTNLSLRGTIADVWNEAVPSFTCAGYTPFMADLKPWDNLVGERIAAISPSRARKRWNTYVSENELERVQARLEKSPKVSIRFGVSKTGQGFKGARGDFCLVGGAIVRRHLTLFYRSLELVGGLGYDLTLISTLSDRLEIPFSRVTIYAVSAFVFAPQCNVSHTKEKLFNQLQDIFAG